MNASIPERLNQYDLMISNALEDADIAAKLAIYLYTQERILEGKGKLDVTKELNERQRKEYGEQYEASEEVGKARKAVEKSYMDSLEIARIAFRANTSARTALCLEGRRKETLGAWLDQVTAFYNGVLGNPDWIAAMGNFGYTAEKLQTEKALVDAVLAARHKQKIETGEAQAATEERDAKMEEIDDWIADFRKIAVIALKDNPQWLEKLGIKA